MSINNNLSAEVPVWQAFQTEIDSIPIVPRVRRTRKRFPSNGFIESAPEHRAHAHSFSNALFR